MSTSRNIAYYLDQFRKRHPDLLARGEPEGYGKRVTTTWRLAFDQIEQADPAGLRPRSTAPMYLSRDSSQ